MGKIKGEVKIKDEEIEELDVKEGGQFKKRKVKGIIRMRKRRERVVH